MSTHCARVAGVSWGQRWGGVDIIHTYKFRSMRQMRLTAAASAPLPCGTRRAADFARRSSSNAASVIDRLAADPAGAVVRRAAGRAHRRPGTTPHAFFQLGGADAAGCACQHDRRRGVDGGHRAAGREAKNRQGEKPAGDVSRHGASSRCVVAARQCGHARDSATTSRRAFVARLNALLTIKSLDVQVGTVVPAREH